MEASGFGHRLVTESTGLPRKQRVKTASRELETPTGQDSSGQERISGAAPLSVCKTVHSSSILLVASRRVE